MRWRRVAVNFAKPWIVQREWVPRRFRAGVAESVDLGLDTRVGGHRPARGRVGTKELAVVVEAAPRAVAADHDAFDGQRKRIPGDGVACLKIAGSAIIAPCPPPAASRRLG
jgi:hypothetical protein